MDIRALIVFPAVLAGLGSSFAAPSAEKIRTAAASNSPMEQVLKLSALAAQCALDGVVCSAHEANAIRDRIGSGFLRVTPGIRLPGDDAGDQKRVMTPERAIQSGATHLVIGMSVTRATDPLAVLAQINSSLGIEVARP
jgi:orotidine-5'-phosphate decarboxylase